MSQVPEGRMPHFGLNKEANLGSGYLYHFLHQLYKLKLYLYNCIMVSIICI